MNTWARHITPSRYVIRVKLGFRRAFLSSDLCNNIHICRCLFIPVDVSLGTWISHVLLLQLTEYNVFMLSKVLIWFVIFVLKTQAGQRICLGREFAYRQMKIFASILLGCFIFKLNDENKTAKYKTMINLHIDGGLNIRVINR